MHVASIRTQIDDWVPDDLPRAVIRHIAAATGLVNSDAKRREPIAGRDDVGAPAVALHAKRNHRWVLQQQEQIGDALGSPLFDEMPLQRDPSRTIVARAPCQRDPRHAPGSTHLHPVP